MKKILWAILAVGFIHRLLFLGSRQLWTDELVQAVINRSSSFGELMHRLREQPAAGPLDFLVQRGVVFLLGESTWTLRLHAVIFGALSIWIFYRIASRLFGVRVALYSTFLFAFFPLEYHYSQEGGPYALLLFLTLVSYDLLLRLVYEDERRWARWLLLCAVQVLLLYQSFLGLLVPVSQLIGLVLVRRYGAEAGPGVDAAHEGGSEMPRTQWRHVLWCGAAALAACIAFLPWARFAWSRPLVAAPSEIADPKIVLRLIKELGDNSYPVAGLLLIGLITGIRALKRHGRRRTLMWLLAWLVPSIPLVLVVEYWSGYFFAIRHILHATPPLVLLAGYGLSYVGERLTILERLPYRVSAPAILYAGLMCLLAIGVAALHWRKEPVDWRGTARFVARAAQPGDAVSMPLVAPLLEYYEPQLAPLRADDLDPGLGALARPEIRRRIVVCYDKATDDPCRGFRAPALADTAWSKRSFAGFTVFLRAAPAP